MLLVCGLIAVILATSTVADVPTTECAAGSGVASYLINGLSNGLATSFGESNTENYFFSPLCMSFALAMTYLGAAGSTAEEMKMALGYPKFDNKNESVHLHFLDLLLALHAPNDDYILEISNGLFAQNNYQLVQSFIDDLEFFYDSEVQYVDFASDGQAAVDSINGWVNNRTAGAIQKLLHHPLDPLTRLILLNAVYFKGKWKEPFDKEATVEKEFHRTDGTTTAAHFMSDKKKFNYFEDSETDYTFLELDYEGGELSMLFALPNSRNDVPTLEITSELLCRILPSMSKTLVHVMIPRFKMAYEKELREALSALGLQEMFQEGVADFSGMREQNDIFVSKVIHKAVIDVNEEGSEAAAVGAVVFQTRSRPKKKLFFADHPFLFCILDKYSRSIIFMGRMMNPA